VVRIDHEYRPARRAAAAVLDVGALEPVRPAVDAGRPQGAADLVVTGAVPPRPGAADDDTRVAPRRRAGERPLAALEVVPARLPRRALVGRARDLAGRSLDVDLAAERERGAERGEQPGPRADQNRPSTKKSVTPAAAAPAAMP